jgi:hypothetical protein
MSHVRLYVVRSNERKFYSAARVVIGNTRFYFPPMTG